MSMMGRCAGQGAIAAVILAAVVSVSGCSKGAVPANEFVARADAKRYDLKGKVVRADLTHRKVTLAHDAIPDYMEAMTMEFSVKEQWAIEQMAAGDSVQATLVIDGARSWIESPAITKGVTAANAPRGSWVPADPGTPLPDVPLVDQDDKPFRLARFKGHLFLITFSFTRCPLPDYCPLMMKHFAAIEKATANDASPCARERAPADGEHRSDIRYARPSARVRRQTRDRRLSREQVLALEPRHRDGGRREEARRLFRARLLRR